MRCLLYTSDVYKRQKQKIVILVPGDAIDELAITKITEGGRPLTK